ncbi:MAG: DUF4956 domain-containing protein [Gemmatimonadaceae bacterium]
MSFVNSVIDTVTLGSDRPVRRLLAYYALLLAAGALVQWLFPMVSGVLFDDPWKTSVATPYLLQDGITGAASDLADGAPNGPMTLVLTGIALVGAMLLMLPVSWVYMSARQVRGHSQAIVQTLIILPIVVAGIVFVVRNSLALAFSLAGVVAAVRFRTTLRDARDVVFVFLAIGVGFAAGVYMLGIAFLVSVFFNFVMLISWRYGFGRTVLSPSAAAQWRDPLNSLASEHENHKVPDREILLALSPEKVSALAERFKRVDGVVNGKKKKRYNAVVTVLTDTVNEAQPIVENVLQQLTKRWVLDEVIANSGKPSEMHYLVRLAKRVTRDELITAVRASAKGLIASVDLEVATDVVEDAA